VEKGMKNHSSRAMCRGNELLVSIHERGGVCILPMCDKLGVSPTNEEDSMAKVVGVHRLALKPGVEAADFEEFVRKEIFPGLHVVIQVDKTISHNFTAAAWSASRHMLLRNTGDDADGNYL
jgi:hypothetical protein